MPTFSRTPWKAGGGRVKLQVNRENGKWRNFFVNG